MRQNVDGLDEPVPVRFQRYVSCLSVARCAGSQLTAQLLIAHATCEIVDACLNHPMSMLSPLGVSFIHGLTRNLTCPLSLTALIRSPRQGILCAHPTPSNYATNGPALFRSPVQVHLHVNRFAAVMLDVLGEHGSAAVWAYKPITHLV
jgi:hypothetical protein